MKKISLLICFLITCTLPLHAVVDESMPWPIPPSPNFPAAPRSGENSALSPAMLATGIGIAAILVVLAFTSFNNHSHAINADNGNS
ncbi:MAG: hypothetical protein P4L16_07105 [Chlamydiales bacterium]|nr:hypothetical protein [Chlamydiales bacterium]